MSITFFMPQAPLTKIQPEPITDPDWWEEVPAEPFLDLNMSNTNAAALIDLVYPGTDYTCGTWEQPQIDLVRRNAMRLLNVNPERFEAQSVTGHNYVFMGRDADYVRDRLTRLLRILALATEYGYKVCYG